jgi:hypothetical protein
MQVAVVSDTHVPTRAGETPEWVRRRVGAADHVVHAGDFDSVVELDRFVSRAVGLTAVRGNVDPPDVELPRVATFEPPGLDYTLVVTHGHLGEGTYRERVARVVAANSDRPPARTLGVCGHTHRLMDERVDGYRLLNPGSATETRPMGGGSMLTVDLAADGVTVTAYHDDDPLDVADVS